MTLRRFVTHGPVGTPTEREAFETGVLAKLREREP
jgi:hypothetical protein